MKHWKKLLENFFQGEDFQKTLTSSMWLHVDKVILMRFISQSILVWVSVDGSAYLRGLRQSKQIPNIKSHQRETHSCNTTEGRPPRLRRHQWLLQNLPAGREQARLGNRPNKIKRSDVVTSLGNKTSIPHTSFLLACLANLQCQMDCFLSPFFNVEAKPARFQMAQSDFLPLG